jgi:hypothetical protein
MMATLFVSPHRSGQRASPNRVPRRQWWREAAAVASAGLGPFSTPQPTPGPDGPCSSRTLPGQRLSKTKVFAR